MDANLNEARRFLLSVVEDQSSPKRATELAARIIVLLAQARSSVEDLLILGNLLDSPNFSVDIRQELESFLESNSQPAAAPTKVETWQFVKE